MRRNVIVFSIFVIIGLLMFNGIGYCWDLAIDAEMAHAIEAPMVIAEDDEASGGQYVWMEGPKATGGGDQGWAEFNINRTYAFLNIIEGLES